MAGSTAAGATSAPPRKQASLRKNFAWTLAGNVVLSACQWAIVIILAKLGNPELVGQYSLALAIALPFGLLTSLNLRGVLATDVRHEFRFGDYLGLRFLSAAVFLMLIAVAALLTDYPVQTKIVLIIVALSHVFESISDIYYGYLQQHERMETIAKSMALRGLISTAFMGVTLWFTRDIVWAMAGLLAGRALILFAYDVRPRVLLAGHPEERASLKPAWNLRNQMKLAWVALPLGVVLMLNALIGNSPRYSMEHYVGIRALGIFSAIATLMAIGTTFVEALGQATAPRLAKHFRSGDVAGFNALLRNLLLIGLAMGVGGVAVVSFIGEDILRVLYSPEYAEQSHLFVLLMVVMAVQYLVSFLGIAMTAARSFNAQMFFSAIGATISIVSSFVLIPRYGADGAAYTLMMVALAQLCGRAATLLWVQRGSTRS